MTLQDFQKICLFVKNIGKKEYVLFMSEDSYKKEFSFLKSLEGLSERSSYELRLEVGGSGKVISSIFHMGILLHIVDPSTLE